MRKLIQLLSLAMLVVAAPLVQTGCKSTTTLEPGGAYTDPYLATTDRSILDASKTLQGFIDWTATNSAFLQKYPQALDLAARVAAQKDGWIRDAYAARDAYATAAAAYRLAGSPPDGVTEVDRRRAQLNGAIAVLANITVQINAYRTTTVHE